MSNTVNYGINANIDYHITFMPMEYFYKYCACDKKCSLGEYVSCGGRFGKIVGRIETFNSLAVCIRNENGLTILDMHQIVEMIPMSKED